MYGCKTGGREFHPSNLDSPSMCWREPLLSPWSLVFVMRAIDRSVERSLMEQ